MAMHNWLTFVTGTWLIMFTCYTPGCSEEPTCAPDQKVGTRLAINSHRNDSGHWVSQVELVHDEPDAPRNSWNMDVHERTFDCVASAERSNGQNEKSFTAISVTLVSRRAGAAAPAAAEEEEEEVRFVAAARLLDGGTELLLSRTHLPWAAARRACQERGLRLADASRGNEHLLRLMLRESRLFHAFANHQEPNAPHQDSVQGSAAPNAQGINARSFDSHEHPHLSGAPNTSHPEISKCKVIERFSHSESRVSDQNSCFLKLPFFCQNNFAPSAGV